MKPIQESTFVTSKIDKVENELSSGYDSLRRSVSAVFEETLKGNTSIEKISKSITENSEELASTLLDIRENQNFTNSRINDIYLYTKTRQAEEEKTKNRWMIFRVLLATAFITVILVLSFIGLMSLIS